VALRQCLRLRLVLLFKRHVGACSWLLRGPFVAIAATSTRVRG